MVVSHHVVAEIWTQDLWTSTQWSSWVNIMLLRKHKKARQWWRTPLIPAFGKRGQADFWVWGQPGLQSEFQDSHGYTEKPCLGKTKPKHQNHGIIFIFHMLRFVLSPAYGLVSRNFHMLLRRTYILWSLGGIFCRYLLNWFDLVHHLILIFLCVFFL